MELVARMTHQKPDKTQKQARTNDERTSGVAWMMNWLKPTETGVGEISNEGLLQDLLSEAPGNWTEEECVMLDEILDV